MKAITLALAVTLAAGAQASSFELNGNAYALTQPVVKPVAERTTTSWRNMPLVRVGDVVNRADLAATSPLAQAGAISGAILVKLQDGADAYALANELGATVVFAAGQSAMLQLPAKAYVRTALARLEQSSAIVSFKWDIDRDLIDVQ